MRAHHREVADELGQYGIRPDMEITRGGHVRFKWKVNDHAQSLVTANTPSDWRGVRNNIARVRKLLRDAGVKLLSQQAHGEAKAAPRSEAERIAFLEDRLAVLEHDMRALLDMLTEPDEAREPEPPARPCESPAPARRRRGPPPADYAWLWRVMRYDEYLPVSVIAKAARRPVHPVAVLFTTLKKRGLVQHKRGAGWRKDRKVEQLDRMNGHAH